ncbi:hypothetical protein SESBI_00867 [Sesbania bispinosa]|nr:hypothetical protein SESBI_00867 [Sesbania bispinosa]
MHGGVGAATCVVLVQRRGGIERCSMIGIELCSWWCRATFSDGDLDVVFVQGVRRSQCGGMVVEGCRQQLLRK